MGIANFRLSFKTSQITNLSTPIIINKIAQKLKSEKYQISEATENSVTFRWNPFRLVWNFVAPYILDGGNFVITQSENGTVVVLNYYINTLSSLLVITALITKIIIDGEYIAIVYFGMFFVAAAIYQYFTTKKVGKELLSEILAEGQDVSV